MQYDIRDLPLLQGVNEYTLRRLEGGYTVKTYEPDDLITAMGDEDKHVFFVIEGEVRKQRYRENGLTVALGICRSGEFFGEEFDGKTVAYDVVATSKCTILLMRNRAFEEMLDNNTIMSRICVKLANSLCRAYSRIENGGLKTEDRVEETIRQEGTNGLLTLRTFSDMAALIGQSREQATRKVLEMIEDGRIRRTIIARNLFSLELLGNVVDN